jgi:hypothetical protein
MYVKLCHLVIVLLITMHVLFSFAYLSDHARVQLLLIEVPVPPLLVHVLYEHQLVCKLIGAATTHHCDYLIHCRGGTRHHDIIEHGVPLFMREPSKSGSVDHRFRHRGVSKHFEHVRVVIA